MKQAEINAKKNASCIGIISKVNSHWKKKYGKYSTTKFGDSVWFNDVVESYSYDATLKTTDTSSQITKVTLKNIGRRDRKVPRLTKNTIKKRGKSRNVENESLTPVVNLTKKELSEVRKEVRKHMNTRRSTSFVLDSGATTHLVKSSKYIRRLLTRMKIIVKDAVGKSHRAAGRGKLRIRVLTEDGTYKAINGMGSATCIQSLMYNLLSVSELTKNGYQIIFKNKNSKIISPEGVRIPVEEKAGLYFVPVQSMENVTSKQESGYTRRVERHKKNKSICNIMKNGRHADKALTTKEDKSEAYRAAPAQRYWKDSRSTINARNAAYRWHLVHRIAGHPSR